MRSEFEEWYIKTNQSNINDSCWCIGGFYTDRVVQRSWEAWQAAKAQAVPELTDKMIVAIEQTVENQLQASGINADPFRLDGEKIWYAAIEAGEKK